MAAAFTALPAPAAAKGRDFRSSTDSTTFFKYVADKGRIPFAARSTSLLHGSLGSALKPCCLGAKEGYSCGNLAEKGEKIYTICDDPQKSFFWDNIHPTQSGWGSVSSLLRSALEQLN